MTTFFLVIGDLNCDPSRNILGTRPENGFCFFFFLWRYVVETRSVIELSRYRAKLELDLIKKLESQTQLSFFFKCSKLDSIKKLESQTQSSFFFSNSRNSTRKIVELLELDST